MQPFTPFPNLTTSNCLSPQEFFIENVLDELDAPGEWFYDAAGKKLYLWHNATGAPADASVEVTQLPVLVNQTGTKQNPVVGVRRGSDYLE